MLSAVDGYSSKAKLQGSIKYVEQERGKDRAPLGPGLELSPGWHGRHGAHAWFAARNGL